LATLGQEVLLSLLTLKGFRYNGQPFQGNRSARTVLITGLPKLNPGLELANTFGVKIGQETSGLFHRTQLRPHIFAAIPD
jgi:hypothetical protein